MKRVTVPAWVALALVGALFSSMAGGCYWAIRAANAENALAACLEGGSK